LLKVDNAYFFSKENFQVNSIARSDGCCWPQNWLSTHSRRDDHTEDVLKHAAESRGERRMPISRRKHGKFLLSGVMVVMEFFSLLISGPTLSVDPSPTSLWSYYDLRTVTSY
jgi:hypothetical protein